MHFYFLWVGGEQSTCFFMCTRRGVATFSFFSTCSDSHILKGNWDDVGPISFWIIAGRRGAPNQPVRSHELAKDCISRYFLGVKWDGAQSTFFFTCNRGGATSRASLFSTCCDSHRSITCKQCRQCQLRRVVMVCRGWRHVQRVADKRELVVRHQVTLGLLASTFMCISS